MAVTFPDAITYSAASVTTADPSFSHTVSSGTDLLLVFVATTANETVSSISWNGSEALSEISRIDEASTNSADVQLSVWGLLSPTAATANVAITGGNDYNAWYWAAALNVHGNDTTALGSAIVLRSSSLNNVITSNSCVHASTGTAGNKLLFAGAAIGDDMAGGNATNDDSFNELLNSNTGGGAGNAADGSSYIAEKNAASGITVNWGATDENVGGLFEIIAAGASIDTSILVPTGPRR